MGEAARRPGGGAPLYLYPVILEGGRKAPYTLRLDPSGKRPRTTVFEKNWRDPFNLDLPELVDPQRTNGLAVNEMLASIRARSGRRSTRQLALMPNVYLGVDYSTFRLWSDFRNSWETMVESVPLGISSSAPTSSFPNRIQRRAPNWRRISRSMDDSQETTIRWALDGRSFRLESPGHR